MKNMRIMEEFRVSNYKLNTFNPVESSMAIVKFIVLLYSKILKDKKLSPVWKIFVDVYDFMRIFESKIHVEILIKFEFCSKN